MADDERPTNGDGFDDWLDEDAGPDTDPYAALSSDDDAEAEIADWMAFTEGDSGPSSVQTDEGTEPGADPVDATAGDEVDAEPDDLDAVVRMEAITLPSEDETAEIPLPVDSAPGDATETGADDDAGTDAAPATSVDFDEFDGGGRADTEEVPIIASSADTEVAVVADDTPPDGDDADAVGSEEPTIEAFFDDSASNDEDDEDTGELPIAGDGGADDDTGELPLDDDEDTGELPIVAAAEPDDDQMGDEGGDTDLDASVAAALAGSGSRVFDLDAHDELAGDTPFDLSQDDYLATATREHEGLAAAIAEAETEDTEQVALAAPIPGLESTVVGFEDVVEAEGHTKARARASGDLVARIITGLVLVLALGASLVWRPALVVLATAVFVIGAGEFYTALRRSGRSPIPVFGFVGILGAALGSFAWGAIAIPVSFFLVATLLLLYYAVVPGRVDPMANLALTVTVMVWAGLGTYAMMIVESEDYRPLVIGVVLTVALMDIAQYFVGRGLGRHPLAPWVSPKKTVEGLVGGVIAALVLGSLLHFIPPFELTSGLAVGAAIAVLSPMGDLAMSAAKRSLGIKDMGSILPGHGGFMDRIDGLLFVIPAAWAIFVWAGLI